MNTLSHFSRVPLLAFALTVSVFGQATSAPAAAAGAAQQTSSPPPQTITLQEPSCRPLPDDAAKLIDKETGTVVEADMNSLVQKLLTQTGTKESCDGLSTTSYIKRNFAPLFGKSVPKLNGPFLIHVMVWGDPTNTDSESGQQQQKVQYQNWYVFDSGHLMRQGRILGGDKVTFLYVHLNVKQTYHALYNFSIAEAIPSNVANLQLLLGVLTGSGKGLEARPANIWGGKELVLDYGTSDITVDAKYFQTLSDLPDISQAARQKQVAAQAAAGNGPAKTTPTDLPGSSPQSALALDTTQKFHDEGPTWWDISVGVPIRKMSQLKLQGDNLTPQSVDKRYAFGLLDLDPFARQRFFHRRLALLAPIAIAGLPLASQPLHQPLIAGGWGPKFVKVYIGVIIAKQPAITTAPKGTCTGWCPQFAFGVNISVKDAKSAISSSTSSSK